MFNWLHNRLKRYSYKILDLEVRFQLFFGYLIFILLPLLVFGFIMLQVSNRKVISETQKTFTQTTTQINSVLNEYISQIDKISLGLYTSSSIPEYFRASSDFMTYNYGNVNIQKEEAYNYIKDMMLINQDIWSVSAITLKGSVLSVSRNGYERAIMDLNNDPYYEPLKNSTGNMVVLPTRTTSTYFSNDKEVFCVGRKYLDAGRSGTTGLMAYTGYVIVECGTDVFERICGNISIGNDGFIVMLSDKGEILYTNAKDKSIDIESAYFNPSEVNLNGSVVTQVDNRKILIVSDESPQTGWSVVGMIPYSEIVERSRDIADTFILLSLFCIITVLIASLIFSKAFVKPLIRLESAFKDFKNGDIGVQVPVYSNNEFGRLSTGFNELITEVDKLTSSIKLAEQRKREIEIGFLYSQIDPHFLYNTLDSIRMLAIIQDDRTTAEAIEVLANLFRYSIKQKIDIVDIHHELTHVKNYIYIQKIRYSKRFNTEYHIDDLVAERKTLRFTLQPIVENAIIHGFSRTRTGGLLSITIYDENGFTVFRIKDNGIGMDPEILAGIRDSLNNTEQSGHIGLRNIDDRLRLFFGEESRLRFSSVKGEGTEVCFRVPSFIDENSGIINILNSPRKKDKNEGQAE